MVIKTQRAEVHVCLDGLRLPRRGRDMGEKPSAAFISSLLGGIFVLLGGIVYAVVGAGLAPILTIFGVWLYLFLVFGIATITGSVIMYLRPESSHRWGKIITVFGFISLFGIITTIGGILSFVGGIVALAYASQESPGPYFVRRMKGIVGSSMFRYIVRRLLYMIPVILGISIIAFITMYAAGDPISLIKAGRPNINQVTIDALRNYYGLDKPIPVQYLNWLWNILHLNFGKSIYAGSVNLIIEPRIWPTIELQIVSLLLAFGISIPIAVYSAKKPYSKQDVTVTSLSLFGVSMPTFWFGLILIIVFSFSLGWLPSAGAKGGAGFLWWGNPFLDQVAHLILPITVLVYVSLAQNIRLIRANMLEVLRSDYVLAARASGLSERKVVYHYALRNAITPAVTFLGIALGGMIAGAPMTEYVFSWPGLGRQYVSSTLNLDFPTIMAITMIITVMTLIANLIMDILYVYIDPRVRIR
jgi:ABC-type dipeptide/oligopeptide/nickel transport system permease component